MRFVPGVLNWSYHRAYGSRWLGTVDPFIDHVASLAQDLGFPEAGIEFGIGGEQDQLPSRDPAYLSHLQRKLQRYRLLPIIIVGQLRVHPEPEVVELSLEECVRNLELAKYLGAVVVTHGVIQHGRVTPEARVRIYADIVGRLADAARAYELQVCCAENYESFSSGDFVAVLERANRPNLGALNDTGNWLILREDPLEATRRLAPWTAHVQIKDYRNDNGIWRSVALGTGTIDLTSILTLLRDEINRDFLILSIETDLDSGDEDRAIRDSARYLLPWLQ
jgi:sugar phosphate isomerase/epimerase